jgi:hypothetical protein
MHYTFDSTISLEDQGTSRKTDLISLGQGMQPLMLNATRRDDDMIATNKTYKV